MTPTTTTARILSIVMFGAISGVFVPYSSAHAYSGIAVVEAFAVTTLFHHASNRRQSAYAAATPTITTIPWLSQQHQQPPKNTLSLQQPPSKTTTRLQSAKILPFVYTGFSGALLYKAKAVTSTNVADQIVLVAMALLSLINLGPSDNARLKSAKIACKKTEEPSEEALAWRKAVRLKIVSQVVGLLRMVLATESSGFLKGATFVIGGPLLFLINGGGGKNNHDAEGTSTPLPEEASAKKLNTAVVLFVVIGVAALKATPMTWQSALVGSALGFFVSVP